MNSKPVVVVGDGWCALGAVGFLAVTGIEVRWIPGTGARVIAPLAFLEDGPGAKIWEELAVKLKVDSGELVQGSFLREFRNKAFREPLWLKAPTPQMRSSVRDEELWASERRMVGSVDSRFNMTLGEIEDEFRKKILSPQFPNLQRIKEVPLVGFKKGNEGISSVILGSGQEIECSQVIYADRWNQLSSIEGMPKPIPFLRKREPMGALQASFTHEPPVGIGIRESFFATLPKGSGEKIERRLFGYFSTDGKHSTWTLCLSPEEVEDNHEIAKKFRRLKSTLDKMFSGNELILAEKKDFMATVIEEQLRFEEEALYADSFSPTEPLWVPELPGVLFLTDGYGPACAFLQIGSALGVEPKSFHPEAENMDLLDSASF